MGDVVVISKWQSEKREKELQEKLAKLKASINRVNDLMKEIKSENSNSWTESGDKMSGKRSFFGNRDRRKSPTDSNSD